MPQSHASSVARYSSACETPSKVNICPASNVDRVPEMLVDVHVYEVLWTPDLTKKSKVWNDGILKLHTFNRRAMLYDTRKLLIDSCFLCKALVEEGETIKLDRHLVSIECLIQTIKHDMALAVKKRKVISVNPELGESPLPSPITVKQSSPAVQSLPLAISNYLPSNLEIGRKSTINATDDRTIFRECKRKNASLASLLDIEDAKLRNPAIPYQNQNFSSIGMRRPLIRRPINSDAKGDTGSFNARLSYKQNTTNATKDFRILRDRNVSNNINSNSKIACAEMRSEQRKDKEETKQNSALLADYVASIEIDYSLNDEPEHDFQMQRLKL
ncbi:hypothetical protein V1511DRAFT_15014 [Dipodascopsis uninucleata]